MTQQQSRIGQQLGHYRLTHLLGSGGFAEVYLGTHIHLHTQAAVKVLHTHLDDADIEAFRQEARMVASLQHPSIVRVFDFGVEHTTPYLVMDYAPNGSLRSRYAKGSIVPIAEIVPVLMQVASALQYAHNHRLIHRDIKPENMLLGQNFELLLSDFGIALITQTSRSVNTQNIAGTIAYMAPEQMQAHPRPASDQYSLGIVVYEWLCGQRPFQGSYTEIAVKHSIAPPPPLHERINLPIAIEQVVLKALQKDPQQRFENVITFAQVFAQVAQSSFQSQQSPTFIRTPPTFSSFPSFPSLPSRPAPYPAPTSPNTPISFSTSAPWNGLTPPLSGEPSTSSAHLPYMFTPTTSTPPYPTPAMHSYAVPPASYQSKGPSFQAPQQAAKSPVLSRRSFIGGGIAGLLVAGGVSAWLYHQYTSDKPLTSILKPTTKGSPIAAAGPETPIFTYSGHHGLVFSISWSPDGTYIASGSQNGECQVWTADKGQLTLSIHSTIQPPISNDFVQSLAWSRHTPPRVAVGFIDGTIQILDVNSRQRLGALAPDQMTNGVFSWSPDEKYLAVCKNITDHAVVIYDVATWNSVFTYQDHTDSVHVVAWSPDGKYLASGSQDTTIRIWEPLNGKTHLLYKEHSGDIAAISWSSDSTKIVSAAQDYVVRIWQSDNGDTLHTHQYQPQAPMGKVIWSPNNQLVAAYPGTGSIDILDTQLTIKQTIQAGVTYDLSWSPDSTRVATANYNNIAQIWRVGS